MHACLVLILGAAALQLLGSPGNPHSKSKHVSEDEKESRPAKAHTLLHHHKRHNKATMCLLQDAGSAGDPYCSKGVASHGLKACCQKDCGECSDVSDVCKGKATNGRGSTCCPAEILAAKNSCADGQAPCTIAAAVEVSLERPGTANAAWDCNKAIPQEMMRQRVAMDYLNHKKKVLNPPGEQLDCDIREVETVEDLALACEKRDGCGGFTAENGEPKCMLGWAEPKADLVDDSNIDTYIRAVDREGFVFHYEVSEWGACSVTCGKGSQDRTLYCRNEYSTDYDLSRCQGLFSAGGAPPSVQDCNDFPCNCEEGQSFESNGLTVSSGVTFAYETSPSLSCNSANKDWTGDLAMHCTVYEAGELQHKSGTCYKKCQAQSSVESKGRESATVVLSAEMTHDSDRTIPCPAKFTGELNMHCDDGTMSIVDGQEPCRGKCMAADILKHVSGESMDSVTVNPYPAIQADMVHEESKHLECPSGSTGSWDLSCDDGHLTATGSCYFNPVLVEGSGGDWTEVACPSGSNVLSGGCEAVDGDKLFQASRPNDAGDGWICGGHGNNKKIWAICSPMPVHQVKVNGNGNEAEAKCPTGTKAIGGGCDAHGSPQLMDLAGPTSDMSGYKCAGWNADKSVWAICAHDDGHYSRFEVSRRDGSGATVQCEVGQTMMGGGCQSVGGKDNANKFERNSPFKPVGWKCLGHGGDKTLWTTCHTTYVSTGCAVETAAKYIGSSGDDSVGEAMNGVDSVEKCCDQCNENPSCEYFVYEAGVCYLKKNYQWKEESSGVVSGVRSK